MGKQRRGVAAEKEESHELQCLFHSPLERAAGVLIESLPFIENMNHLSSTTDPTDAGNSSDANDYGNVS
jgi:hypothetical protein